MISPDHPNAKLLDELYASVAKGDMSIAERAIIGPFVAHTAGHAPIGGDFVGFDAFIGHIGLLRKLSGGTMRRTKIAFFADDRWAVTPQSIAADRNGVTLEMEVAGFWRFKAPGQIAEHWEAVADVAAWDAFWMSPQ